ncbi:apoptosis facilitator Bcl-2-like protein 14 [Kryptolebias marmoratus]|uniref:apoptosis facilitator Bcl-2-like protein 14 n=1 Tax=Kryptolebias marmoratus TaxID=37003 RepID=UPI000D530408|nr:apoptosis facilitator Bcl-2-like protein 14 [Kryptolebias marmoratus]
MEGPQEASEVLQLLEDYCTKRSFQRLGGASRWRRLREMLPEHQGAFSPDTESSGRSSKPPRVVCLMRRCLKNVSSPDTESSESPRRIVAQGPAPPPPSLTRRRVTERLVEITESAPIRTDVQTQEEIVQKLVQLMITFGDDINAKIKQNPILEQQLQNLNYNMFEKVTSTVQNLVGPAGQAAGPEGQTEQQKIAWAFEVTSRLSAVGVVHHRRVLNFGVQYIEQNHTDWVQQHGGWANVFDID